MSQQGAEWSSRQGVRVQQAGLQGLLQAVRQILWHWKQQHKKKEEKEKVPKYTDKVWHGATLQLRSHSCKHYRAITPLTITIQERDEGLQHHSKRVTVPRVSIFIRKYFKALNLSTRCVMSHVFWIKAKILPFFPTGPLICLPAPLEERSWPLSHSQCLRETEELKKNWRSKHKSDLLSESLTVWGDK